MSAARLVVSLLVTTFVTWPFVLLGFIAGYAWTGLLAGFIFANQYARGSIADFERFQSRTKERKDHA